MFQLQEELDVSGEVVSKSPKKENLLISFGGIRMGLGMPVFEFYNFLKEIDCDKVFIKDIKQSWYHKGITNEDSNINHIAKILKDFIVRNEYKNICFLGNSMGGYAAIVLGTIVKANKIIAFSPQTFIDKKNRFFFRDNRWDREIEEIYKYYNADRSYFDLKKYFKKHHFEGKIELYYSTKDKLDKIHAERLTDFSFVILHSYSFGGHGLVSELKNSGSLRDIFSKMF